MTKDKFEFSNPYHVLPPGSNIQILSHPAMEYGSMELAVFQDHRYAFFYWLRWTQKKKLIPALVTLDWHQDLCFPDDGEKDWLLNLNIEDPGEVALFCWAKLNGNNDGHILCAAYLNLIGNIYVHCRQGTFDSDWEDEAIVDYEGNTHVIKKFREYSELERELLGSKEKAVYLDIDLDFFSLENSTSNDKYHFTYLSNEQIDEILRHDRPLMQWIFERMVGMTVATEPECTGGLLKSNQLLEKINSLYFSPDIFTGGCNWKWKERL